MVTYVAVLAGSVVGMHAVAMMVQGREDQKKVKKYRRNARKANFRSVSMEQPELGRVG